MTIGADARTHRASVALQVLLTDALVNHAAHFVVDGDEFVKARATREAAIGTFTRVKFMASGRFTELCLERIEDLSI